MPSENTTRKKRPERRIEDYFEHVAKLDQDMAVEIIFQCGDKQFWEEYGESKERFVKEDIKDEIEQSKLFMKAVDQIKRFILSYLPYVPLIEAFANTVEQKSDIVAGNSYRGVLSSLGELWNSFKEKLQERVCWFPRLMRWKTSKGEVSPAFMDFKNEGNNYRLRSFANVRLRRKSTRLNVLNRKLRQRIGWGIRAVAREYRGCGEADQGD